MTLINERTSHNNQRNSIPNHRKTPNQLRARRTN
jgi:hypothetical protein